MSPILAYHATRQACRDSIREAGLIAARPTRVQPHGVYVFHRDIDNGGGRSEWARAPRLDLWKVAYIGPIKTDPFVFNALVLLESVPAEHVTLVTCN